MAPSETPGAVLFDIDGTLVDSNYLHVAAWAAAFQEAGRAVDAVDIHRAIGMGSAQLVIRLLGENEAAQLGERITRGHTAHYQSSLATLRRFSGTPTGGGDTGRRGVGVVGGHGCGEGIAPLSRR